MRISICLAAFAVVASSVAAAQQTVAAQEPAAQQQTPAPSPHVDKARAFVDLLVKRDFAAAVAGFDATMTKMLTEAKLREFWTTVVTQAGAFQAIDDVRAQPRGPYTAVVMTSSFERAKADITVVYDAAGRIAGFNIRPAAPPASPPPPYADVAAFAERDVVVGSGEWAVPGTLSLPKGAGPFPAVVLVHGSGPNDRDETVGPNKPFRDIAHGLASRGIAVLRYDKRTMVHGAKLAQIAKPTVAEEAVDDAALAVQALAAMPEIARDRIFVLGHSLGGMLVPRIAAAAPQARGFIVMAGPARPMEQAMLEQTQYMAGLDGAITPDEQARIDEMQQVVEGVRALTPENAESAEPLAGVPPSYWLDLRGYDPPAAAKAVTRPMLVLHGERDYQVTMPEFERWKDALEDRDDVTMKSYRTLNHLFMPGTGPGNPQEYAVAGHVAEEVVRDIAEWIAELE